MDITDVSNAFKTYLQRRRKLEAFNKEPAIAFVKLFQKLYQRKISRAALQKEFEQNPNMYCKSMFGNLGNQKK
jgi:hypothetical protein